MQVPRRKSCRHPVNIRMKGQCVRLQMPIDKSRGHVNIRLRYHYMTCRRRSQRCQYFPDSLREHGPALNAVGNIRSQRHTEFFQLLHGISHFKKCVQPPQSRRRIRAAACHARRNRNPFLQGNGNAFRQKSRRPINQIILVRRKICALYLKTDSRLLPFLKSQIIADIHGLHNHLHFVIAVRSAPQHIQSQIYFCISFFSYHNCSRFPLTAVCRSFSSYRHFPAKFNVLCIQGLYLILYKMSSTGSAPHWIYPAEKIFADFL